MRPIDADALRDAMYHEAFETDSDMQRWDSGCWIRYKMFEKAIESAPTIDPVKHGKWESDEFLYTTGQTICSACKTGFYVDDLLNVGEGAQEFLPNYCPHCGARMDGE